jgi:hypothetical protein
MGSRIWSVGIAVFLCLESRHQNGLIKMDSSTARLLFCTLSPPPVPPYTLMCAPAPRSPPSPALCVHKPRLNTHTDTLQQVQEVQEVQRLQWLTIWGADTTMDLLNIVFCHFTSSSLLPNTLSPIQCAALPPIHKHNVLFWTPSRSFQHLASPIHRK